MKQNCKRIFSLLLCAALVCTLFAGCGGRNKQLDIIYPITGDITSFDPQVAATQDEYLIAENCYEGLVRVEDDGTVKPAVAADWTVSTDQKTYTFHLRQGLKWHLTDAVTERMGKNWDPDITAHDFCFCASARRITPDRLSPIPCPVRHCRRTAGISGGKERLCAASKGHGRLHLGDHPTHPGRRVLFYPVRRSSHALQ